MNHQLKDIYSETYGKQAKSPARRYSYFYRLELIEKALEGQKCSNLLDIGGASGDYVADLTKDKKDLQCFLIDINRDSLLLVKYKNKKIYCIQARWKYLPFQSRFFDFVLMLNSARYFETLLIREFVSDGEKVHGHHGCQQPDD